MGCWKCSCGRYVDTSFDRCFFCMRPKPGTVKQGDIEYTLTFIYVQKGRPMVNTTVVKGPINITTGPDHKRLMVTNIVSSGSSTEYLSFEWENNIPHGNPLQIWPMAEGGFEATCVSPSFTVNGMEFPSGKNPVEAGSVLMLSPAMAIKLEDFRGATFMEGSLSPVGCRVSGNLDASELYMPPNGTATFFNGLNATSRMKYVNAGAKETKPIGETDWGFVNKSLLGMFGVKFKAYRSTIEALEDGRT